MKRVGLIYDPIYLQHETGTHIENAQRITTTLEMLTENQLQDKLISLSPRTATIDELSKVHAREYVLQVEQKCKNGGGWFDPDTVASSGSYQAAAFAAGGTIAAVDAVMTKEVDSAFALVRPPGHHATCWHAMGFCFFNNIAVAAKYVLANYEIQRILIIDFDVHHGNGTQDIFIAEKNVLYFSIHQYPFYPGSGNADEIGIRGGEGFTVNVPMIAGWGDEEYQTVFEDVLAPIALRFQPELILVSAGYDAHWADKISGMQVSVTGFARLTEIITLLSVKLCQGNVVFALEGGYQLQALSASIGATLNILLGSDDFADPLGKPAVYSRSSTFDSFIKTIKDKHEI